MAGQIKATVIALQLPAAIIIPEDKNYDIKEIAQKFEKSEAVIKATQEYVDKLVSFLNDEGYENTAIVVVPAILPQTDKQIADATANYIDAIFGNKDKKQEEQSINK